MRHVVSKHGIPTENGMYRVWFHCGDLNCIERTIQITGDSYRVLPDGATFDAKTCLLDGDIWERIGD